MITLDQILFDALMADDDIKDAVKTVDKQGTVTGYRIKSTCFEVGPDGQDNTPLPCIIVTDDGLQNELGTKDDVWEGSEDKVQASIEVDGRSPREVSHLLHLARHAVAAFILGKSVGGGFPSSYPSEQIPYLDSVVTNGTAWDWMKPCYHSTITYTCIIQYDYE